MAFTHDSLATNAMGGTELMKYGMKDRIPQDLLDNFQIFVSRVEEPLDESKVRLYWLHDLPGDPASEHLKNGGWQKFHKLIFVSNWQMQAYMAYYSIPWSHCLVIQNAIEPIEEHTKPTDKIRLAYWSTPHRGLEILVPVFDKLCEKYDNIELDVYSSFNLYGWAERDEPYKALFERCCRHPKINYFGTVDNKFLRENLKNTHIFAYPSIWPETSCMCLMEAMSAGMLCVHPNFAALPETAANWTNMYQFHEDANQHAGAFYNALSASIETLNDAGVQTTLSSQKAYADIFYSWNLRQYQWTQLLLSMKDAPRELPKPQAPSGFFEYRT
jgi:UDP-glucose:(glucosyl)LPS alpha-1,2-glucosyltransferase